MAIQDDVVYQKLSQFANPDDAEGLAKERAILLLWFLRTVKAIDPADAFEFICDGDDDGGIDGLWMESYETDDGEQYILNVFQSKYPESASQVGENDLATFYGKTEKLQSAASIAEFVAPEKRRQIRDLVDRLGIIEKLERGVLTFRLEFVTAGILNGDAQKYVRAINTARGTDYLRVWDLRGLAPIVAAYDSPTPVQGLATFACPVAERFVTQVDETRVLVGTVKATDLVSWPGIHDRTLFDLNVRRELRRNKVRNQIDRSLKHPTEHASFLASHNGITVICREIDDTGPANVVLKDLSVVNGAQSIIAFYDARDSLTDELRVVIKVCELNTATQLARNIAIRSNTQNPVNSRNLRARDGAQLRIQKEFESVFPDIVYETRPDASNAADTEVIENDKAAKLLCAVFNRRPWLAVKTLSLFEGQDYAEIFNPDVHAEHVVFAQRLRDRIDASKEDYPPPYQGPWVLTSIIATWLASEALRAVRDDQDLQTVAPAYFADPEPYEPQMAIAVEAARKALQVRYDQRQSKEQTDDFKVDFKNQKQLEELRDEVRRGVIYMSA